MRRLTMALALVAVLIWPTMVMAAAQALTISEDPGEDSFTMGVVRDDVFNVSVSVSGTFVGTVTLQRSFDRAAATSDAAATWRDVAVYTAGAEDIAYEPEYGVYYRLGIKNGEYTSGSVTMRIGK